MLHGQGYYERKVAIAGLGALDREFGTQLIAIVVEQVPIGVVLEGGPYRIRARPQIRVAASYMSVCKHTRVDTLLEVGHTELLLLPCARLPFVRLDVTFSRTAVLLTNEACILCQ